jgi:hypothetical protein
LDLHSADPLPLWKKVPLKTWIKPHSSKRFASDDRCFCASYISAHIVWSCRWDLPSFRYARQALWTRGHRMAKSGLVPWIS